MVAIVGFFAALLCALIAEAYAARRAEDSGAQCGQVYIRSAVKELPATVKSFSLSKWILAGLCGALIAYAAVRADQMEIGLLTGTKLSVTAILLLGAAWVDARSYLIPNGLVLALLLLRVGYAVAEFILLRDIFGQLLFASVIGLVIGLILLLLMLKMTKGGFGMGDVKLIAALGWMMGIGGLLYTLFFASFACVFGAIGMLLLKKKTLKDKMPFGPYIFVGFCISVLLGMF